MTVGGKVYTVKVRIQIPKPKVTVIRTPLGGSRYRYTFKYNIPGATKIKVRPNTSKVNVSVYDRYLSKPKSDSESYVNLDLKTQKKVSFRIVAYYGKNVSKTRVITK